ncbi:hypothetical protein V6N13_014092 [Hibiscus sabdariffa]
MPGLVMLVLLFLLNLASSYINQNEFSFNGYLNVDGTARLDPSGLLKLTNTSVRQGGHIFYKNPIQFKNFTGGGVSSFSTAFIFAIVPEYLHLGGHGMAFVISPNNEISGAPGPYLGLFNATNQGNSSNHIVAIELDTVEDFECGDIDDNHVGIDINSPQSVRSKSAGYFTDEGEFKSLNLKNGDRLQIWVEYNGVEKQLDVTLHPIGIPKPKTPLLSLKKDLSPYMYESMFVGFSSSTGLLASSHYILAWSFKINGKAEELDLSRLPKIPRRDDDNARGIKQLRRILALTLSLTGLTLVLVVVFGAVLISRKKRFIEILEDWEVQYGPHRFSYKDVFKATKGFKEKEVLGRGGFGTFGYMAPELARAGKASTSTDVYAFGLFLLEIACGRRPIEARAPPDEAFLADWIVDCWDKGDILATVDGRLEKNFVVQEAELVLKLGLFCSHPVAAARPSMSSVISYLDGVASLPADLSSVIKAREFPGGSNDELITAENNSIPSLTITESFVSHGR